MKPRCLLAVCALPLVLLACRAHRPVPPPGPVPALLLPSSAEVWLGLEAAASELIGQPVTLDDDAFAEVDFAEVEPDEPRENDGSALAGQVYGRPQTLRLLKHGEDCVLLNQDSGQQRVVTGARCRIAPSV